MQRSALGVLGALGALGVLAAMTGCAPQECTHLGDCPGGEVCSVDGTCVADERPRFFGARGGPLEVRDTATGIDVDGPAPGSLLTGDPGDVVGRIRGDIGPVRGFDDVASGYVTNDDLGLYANVSAQGEPGWGLVIVQIAGGLASLPAGATYFQGSNDEWLDNYVQVCSDNASGSVHFDAIAEEAVVIVTPDEDGEGADVVVEAVVGDGFDGSSPGTTVVAAGFRVE